MNLVALKMFIGNRASFIGVIFGIFLATLLISQQSAIFLGLIARSYRLITDIPAPNIWVMDPATESEEKLRTIPEGYLDLVRSTPGVQWASAINFTNIPLSTPVGRFEISKLYGIDEASWVGAPIHMIEGNIRDLYQDRSVIIDTYSAHSSLATLLPNGTKVPLKKGDELEINKKRAVVVGICDITQGFYPQPIIFTTHREFQRFTSRPGDSIGFIAVKTLPDFSENEVAKKISSYPYMSALTKQQFKERIIESFLKTGILINFGLSVGLGIIIGFSIAGQIFYNMILESLMYFALIKALGGTKKMILQMILLQALLAGALGFLLGIGMTILWGMAIQGTTLAFLFPWQLLVFTGGIILTICLSTAILSIRKVFGVDAKVLMGS